MQPIYLRHKEILQKKEREHEPLNKLRLFLLSPKVTTSKEITERQKGILSIKEIHTPQRLVV